MFLNAHSYYSLRYGTITPQDLPKQAKQMGAGALVLTDINCSTGVFDFYKSCLEHKIKPIVGIEFRRENKLLYIGIARNNTGFLKLNEFLTNHNLNKIALPDSPPLLSNVYFIFAFGNRTAEQLRENEWIGIRINELSKLISQKRNLERFVVLHPITFSSEEDFMLHKQMRAIHHNVLLSRLETYQHALPNEHFISVEKIRDLYSQFPTILKNTEGILDECSVAFEIKAIKNKQTFTGKKYEDRLLLEKLAIDGWKQRYGDGNKTALARVRHELDIIENLGFSAYFLITWDIIRYSMARGFYHVGRGSGANSVVAYCLKITDVCPIELDLYFERFLNPKRKSPPDFDIDYSWRERDDVLDYIFKRYGYKHTALLGAISTFKDRSIPRELGKVHGLPKSEIDNYIDEPETELNRNQITEMIEKYRGRIEDFPNIRSIHAGGVLISEEPITSYTSLDMPPKGFPTAQFDMYIAEDIGFEKLDILSQRGIGHIKDCADIVYKNRGIKIDVHEIEKFKTDPRVKEQLKSGDTIGCFYVESPAMRGLLKKLRCDNYISLVAASSIIRPGVAKSGMMRQYIYRFHNPDKFKYLHPVMEQQLKETYGVMVFQEDVLKVCHHFAGLDLADADVLRRMMSGKGKHRNDIQRIIDKFFSNCKERGYSDELTKEVWRQIESFAGYSFSKAHSASYAVESYQSLYLKTYFPQEFMVAVINNFGGFYSTSVYVNEAKKSGANVLLPCVNKSLQLTTIYDNDIYLGFIHIEHLEKQTRKTIVEERLTNGDYQDIEDFAKRTGVSIEQILILVKIGAFRFTGKSKRELYWETHILLGGVKKKEVVHNELFYTAPESFDMPALQDETLENLYDEIELLGFTVTQPIFEMLKTDFRGEVSVKNLIQHLGKKIRLVGNYAAAKYVRTVRGEIMYFATFLDHEGNFFDTTHFPDSIKKYPLKGRGIYLLLGKVVEEFGFPSIEVEKCSKLPLKPDPRS